MIVWRAVDSETASDISSTQQRRAIASVARAGVNGTLISSGLQPVMSVTEILTLGIIGSGGKVDIKVSNELELKEQRHPDN